MTNKIISDFDSKLLLEDSDLILIETASGEYKASTALAIKNYVLGLNPEVILLLPMDSNFENAVLTQPTVTAINNPTINNSIFKFGGGSGLFNGSNQCLEADWVSGQIENSTEWTIEGWFYLNNITANQTIFAFNTSSGGNRFILQFRSPSNGGLQIFIGGSQLFIDNPSGSTWHHFCVSKNGDTTNYFIDGALNLTTGTSNSYAIVGSDQFYFGQEFDGSTLTDFWNGYFDDLRVIKNFSRNEAFTIPSQGYTLEP